MILISTKVSYVVEILFRHIIITSKNDKLLVKYIAIVFITFASSLQVPSRIIYCKMKLCTCKPGFGHKNNETAHCIKAVR